MKRYKRYTKTNEAPGGFMEKGELKHEVAKKMKRKGMSGEQMEHLKNKDLGGFMRTYIK